MKKTFFKCCLPVLTIISIFILYSCKDDETPVMEGTFVISSSVSDVDIHYTVKGKGMHAVVFVHGWSCDQTYWENQVDSFDDNYKVVTVDLGGHGQSGVNRTDWTIASFGSDVIDVINAIEFEKLSLVRHSMGAMVVIDAASKIEQLVNTLVCVDYLTAPLMPLSDEVAEGLIASFQDDFVNSTKNFVSNTFFRPDADPTFVDEIANDMSSASPEVAIPALLDLIMRDYGDNFNTLSTKGIDRYIINSDLNDTDAVHYASLGFNINIIEETGHFVMMEKPNSFNLLLEEIINQ